MNKQDQNSPKCYNSYSCVGAVLIIIFVLGSILWDICVTKPAMKKSIEEIRIELKSIHDKIDDKIAADTIDFATAYKAIEEENKI